MNTTNGYEMDLDWDPDKRILTMTCHKTHPIAPDGGGILADMLVLSSEGLKEDPIDTMNMISCCVALMINLSESLAAAGLDWGKLENKLENAPP